MKKISTIMATCGLALMAVSTVQATQQITCQITGQLEDFNAFNCSGETGCSNNIWWAYNNYDQAGGIKSRKDFNKAYDLSTLVANGNCRYNEVGNYNTGDPYTMREFSNDLQEYEILAVDSRGEFW